MPFFFVDSTAQCRYSSRVGSGKTKKKVHERDIQVNFDYNVVVFNNKIFITRLQLLYLDEILFIFFVRVEKLDSKMEQ